MIHIAVVEDDDLYANTLYDYLERFQKEENVSLTWKRFRDGDEIVENYEDTFHIILMDIEMQFMNGMEAADHIRKVDEQVEIIFVTNMAQYAISGYKVGALDYIVKPVEYMPFRESLKRAIRNADRRQKSYITLSLKEGIKKLYVGDVTWIESRGHRLTFHTQNDNYETTVYTITEMEEKLAVHGFSRCNSGLLVNLRYVSGISGNQVIVNQTQLPLSRGRKNNFMEDMVSYLNQ